MNAAGQNLLILHTLLPMGVLTVATAALFLIKQRDIKRLLAYSSMENVGLMATAIALNSSTGFALQAINHSCVKVALFLIAGNLLQQFNTKKIREIHGLLKSDPMQATLLIVLAIAIAGAPPFGSFLAEWQILMTALNGHHYSVVVVLLAALALAFITIVIHISGMLFGKPIPVKMVSRQSPILLSAAPVILITISLLLGLALTPAIMALAGGLH
jgi:hydrogenase-4 component F